MELDLENGKVKIRDNLEYEFKEIVTRKELAKIKELRNKHAKFEEGGVDNLSPETIEKIEEVTEISVDDQARDKGCWDEYLTYQTINGKNPRRKFIYKEVA